MKICILSMQRVLNYGSVLQSYALQNILLKFANQVEFIDIEPNSLENKLLDNSNSLKKIKSNNDRKQTIFKKAIFYPWRQKYVKSENDLFQKIIEEFQNKILKLNIQCNSNHYDYCIIGSDEVFNCMSGAPWGFTSQLFGNVKQSKNVLTYAASCGSTKVSQLPQEVKNIIADNFNKLPVISVRDHNTEKFVTTLTKTPVVENSDPVFIYDFKSEMENVTLPQSIGSKYCIVYSYYKRFDDVKEINAIKKFASEHHLEVISIEGPQMWIKHHEALDPFETLKAFKYADFVITDTFHGAVFATKYSKRYGVIIRDSNKNKLQDFLKKVNRDNHIITNININTLNYTYSIENDLMQIEKLQKKEYSETISYFRSYLK